jgi:hypothetical protein
MTHFPPPALHERRRKTLRVVGMLVSALMVLTVLTVLALIFRNERAHDEDTCPFQAWSERTFPGGKVFEEQRNCIENITERRYRVARGDKPAFELARKRLSSDRFAQDRYRWELDGVNGTITVRVFVDDKLSSEFREEDMVSR